MLIHNLSDLRRRARHARRWCGHARAATTLHLTAVVTPDDDWFMARCVEVPVVSQGPTVDEALANLTEALELYFEDEPAPTPPIVRPINIRIPA